jgi:hypothetical protein
MEGLAQVSGVPGKAPVSASCRWRSAPQSAPPRDQADLAAAAFAATLKDTVDLDSVREDLASVVRRVLELAPEP